ncbi:MAG: hypothetical protein P8X57_01050 [Cyclobacteriaceae bacterium]
MRTLELEEVHDEKNFLTNPDIHTCRHPFQETTSRVKQENPDLQKNTEKAAEEKVDQSNEKESVLSFNFLYYLIQKFKLSEAVE